MAAEGEIESGRQSHSLGSFCDDLGLTKENCLEKLGQLVPGDLKNSHIIELMVHIQAAKIPWISILDSLCQVYGGLEGVSAANLRRSFVSVKSKRVKLQKSKVHEPVLAVYLSELYVLPAVPTTCNTANNTPTPSSTPVDEVDGLPLRKKPLMVRFEEDVKREVAEKLAKEVSTLEQRIHFLENENKQLVNSAVELKQDNVELMMEAQLKAKSLAEHCLTKWIILKMKLGNHWSQNRAN